MIDKLNQEEKILLGEFLYHYRFDSVNPSILIRTRNVLRKYDGAIRKSRSYDDIARYLHAKISLEDRIICFNLYCSKGVGEYI